MARSYNKTSPFWAKNKTPEQPKNDYVIPTMAYEGDGLEPFSAIAACGGGSSNSYRDGASPTVTPVDSYRNIESGLLPWEARSGKVSISRAVLLCQKAAANVAIVRNTIETCVEFSNAPLHIKTSNLTVKTFFENWLKKINSYKLIDNFMREYYRSGNVFMYKFVGKIKPEAFKNLKGAFAAKGDVIPIRYIIMNPAQVYLLGGISYSNNHWAKILSTYEIESLRDPKTEEDKQIFNSLPEDVKTQIMNGAGWAGVYIPLDPNRLYYVFYKKQDYEPLAVPMIFPVLNDIEYKLELKKMDMSLSRTIEHMILLVTNGEAKTEYGGGVNPQNLTNIQNIFRNQTLGRVLVADYTTKAEWLIPDISKIIGPEKYQQVEKDIQEGLQSIFGSTDEKFANAQIKAKIFIERMKEAQRAFLNNFLTPEINKICEVMGFKNVPEAIFEELSLDDPAVMARIYTQLLQLGVLTPAEVTTALQTGILPDKESNLAAQQEYKKQRDDGLYFPLVGGSQPVEEGVAGSKPTPPGQNGRPSGVNTKKSTTKVGPIGKSKGEEKFSAKRIAELSILADKLKDNTVDLLKKEYKIKNELDDAQKFVAEALAKSILSNETPDKWVSATIKEYIKVPKETSKEIAAEIDDISYRFDTNSWQAALLRNCKIVE